MLHGERGYSFVGENSGERFKCTFVATVWGLGRPWPYIFPKSKRIQACHRPLITTECWYCAGKQTNCAKCLPRIPHTAHCKLYTQYDVHFRVHIAHFGRCTLDYLPTHCTHRHNVCTTHSAYCPLSTTHYSPNTQNSTDSTLCAENSTDRTLCAALHMMHTADYTPHNAHCATCTMKTMQAALCKLLVVHCVHCILHTRNL